MNDGGRIRPDSLAGTSLDPDLVIDFDLNEWPVSAVEAVAAAAGRPSPNERRALHALLRYREPGVSPYRRITPAMRADLLGWAATLSDEELLDMRNVGKTLLRWIRDHQPLVTARMGVNPELPGVNMYVTTCIHGVDLRFTPRCYLCKPWPDDSPVWKVASPGHVHDGEWCALCVEHGRAAAIIDGEATSSQMTRSMPTAELQEGGNEDWRHEG
jgi:hypothetical protein